MGHAGDDGARSRRPCLEPAGAQVKAERPPCRTAKPQPRQHGRAHRAVARPASASRCAAACLRGRHRPAAAGPAGQLARATRHGSDLHPDLPRVHGRAGAFRGRPVLEQAAQGVAQYVILGAGLDSFAQRRPDIASRMRVFEVDQPAPQNGSAGDWSSWVTACRNGCNWSRWTSRPALPPASAGRGGLRCDAPGLRRFHGRQHVSDRDATLATFRQVAALAPGSTLAMTFVLPVEQMAPEVRPGIEMAVKGARASGTPFISFYAPAQIMAMAREAGSAMSGTSRPPCSRSGTSRANGRLELVERRRISDCGHVAGEYCPTADPALIPGHQTARHPTRQAPAR